MKKYHFILLSLFLTVKLFSQTQGINYQAVIVDQNAQEIAGKDVSGNIIPNRDIMVRFTIQDMAGTTDYQEEHATTTDAYGIINLTIGKGIPAAESPKSFIEIDWNGTSKVLKVDISLSQTDIFYTDFSKQELTYIPYAYHKNITATGTLKVDNKSTLQDVTVEATTNLNGSLDVNNSSPANLTGSLSVKQNTTLEDVLTVNSISNLNGQVTITADISGPDDEISGYPLYVKGSNQGIAIKVDGSRDNSNNFVTFWDDAGIQGRIEGESTGDIESDPLYYYETTKLAIDIVVAGAELTAAATSSTICAGIAPCVTAPSPSEIAFAIAQLAFATADLALYNVFRWEYAGVVYESKGADYAEYLPKTNPEEKFMPGDIVGMKGGYVSLSTQNTDRIMIVSRKPVVLGNMPKEGMENVYEKIAFIGQVEAKVFGKVNVGDYIIPSGRNDGAGIALSPENIDTEDYLNIAGIAWSASKSDNYNYVNVAIGLNSADIARLNIKQEKKIKEQEEEINLLKEKLNLMNNVLAQLIPEYAELMGDNIITGSSGIRPLLPDSSASTNTKSNAVKQDSDTEISEGELTIYYHDISREQIVDGINLALDLEKKENGSLEKNPLFKKLESDNKFKETFISDMHLSVKKKLEECYIEDLKSGVNVIKNF